MCHKNGSVSTPSTSGRLANVYRTMFINCWPATVLEILNDDSRFRDVP